MVRSTLPGITIYHRHPSLGGDEVVEDAMKCPECNGTGRHPAAKTYYGDDWWDCWCDDGYLSIKSWIGYWLMTLGEKML